MFRQPPLRILRVAANLLPDWGPDRPPATFKKQRAMNRISAIALFAAAFVTFHSASAQKTLSVTKIPFAFTVNGTTLPAGTYTMSSLAPKLLQIRSNDFKHPMAVNLLVLDVSEMHLNHPADWFSRRMGTSTFCMRLLPLPVQSMWWCPPRSWKSRRAWSGPARVAVNRDSLK